MKIIFFDIGGANLKYAISFCSKVKNILVNQGNISISNNTIQEFELELEYNIYDLTKNIDCIYFTTTAPLLYESLKIGATRIVELIKRTININLKKVYYYSQLGEFKSIDQFKSEDIAGCFNWCITRDLVKKFRKNECLIIDCGSTSTDIIPVNKANINYLPNERLLNKEALYIGMRRTLVQTIVNEVPVDGISTRIVGEPTTLTGDVNYILGYINDKEYLKKKGINSKYKLLKNAKFNVARLICSDLELTNTETINCICKYINEAMAKVILNNIKFVLNKNNLNNDCDIILCGKENKFIETKVLENLNGNKIIYLEDVLNLKDVQYTPAIGMLYIL